MIKAINNFWLDKALHDKKTVSSSELVLISAIYGGETALSTGRIEHLVVHGASCNQPEGLEMTLGVGDPGLSCTAVPSDDTMSRAPARCSATIRCFSVFWENSLPRVSPSRGFSQFFLQKKVRTGNFWRNLKKLVWLISKP